MSVIRLDVFLSLVHEKDNYHFNNKLIDKYVCLLQEYVQVSIKVSSHQLYQQICTCLTIPIFSN